MIICDNSYDLLTVSGYFNYTFEAYSSCASVLFSYDIGVFLSVSC